MDAVLRGVAIYVALMIFFRITGKRSLGEATTFDFVLLLIVGEATQQALLGDDFSVTNAVLVILTLMVMDIAMNWLKERSPRLDKAMEDLPVVLVSEGQPLEERMSAEGVDRDDVLIAARKAQGLARMEEIRYAVLERDGSISIIPRQKD